MFPRCPGLITLAGPTGSGKTAILEALFLKGYPVINLEKLANHKGSVFGALDSPIPQPSQQDFSEHIERLCRDYNAYPYVITEQEAPAIGKRRIPEWFFQHMQSGFFIYLDIPKKERVKLITAEYGNTDKKAMCEAIEKLNERLSPERISELKSLVLEDNFAGFAERMLDYYDQSYHYKDGSGAGSKLSFASFDLETMTAAIEQQIKVLTTVHA